MHRYQDTIDSRSVVSRRVRVTSAVERVNFSLGSALSFNKYYKIPNKKEAYYVVKTV